MPRINKYSAYLHLLVVRNKVGWPPAEFGVSKSMGCDIFPSVLWHCWLGDRKGIRSVKKLDVGLLVVMIWLELCMIYSSSCQHHFHHPLLQKTLANSGLPGKWPLKRTERQRERICWNHCGATLILHDKIILKTSTSAYYRDQSLRHCGPDCCHFCCRSNKSWEYF